MKTLEAEIVLDRWPYGLILENTKSGLFLHPKLSARKKWAKQFRKTTKSPDELASTRSVANEFDAGEWVW